MAERRALVVQGPDPAMPQVLRWRCRDLQAEVARRFAVAVHESMTGSRPPMVRDNRHGAASLFGAICADRAVGAAIIMPGVNAAATREPLAEISTRAAPGAHAVMLCHGAGWPSPADACARLTISRSRPCRPIGQN
jgi:hypothetical protein